jgi:hypothetical protein
MIAPLSEDHLRELYAETIDALYGYASRRCGGNRSLAEDVTQEVWLRAVREWRRHQVSLLDPDLSLKAVVRDSASGSATSYGPRPVPLMRYSGDSSILADNQAGTLLVLGPTGSVVRAMAPSHPDMMPGLNLYYGATDDRGRIIFESHVRQFDRGVPGGIATAYASPESTVLVRADLDSRAADTLARLKTWPSTMMINNSGVTRFTMDPLPLIDTWAMASDGSIAVIRGRDYHIDWIHADGTTHSTPKLPFDWKRITDEEKQRVIDSVRTNESIKLGRALGQRRVGPRTDDGGRGGRGYAPGGTIEQGPPVPVEYVPPKLSEMFDYYPPIRPKAALPDLDGNIWILPTSSAQSKNGELVYDVVNVKGDFHRVRFPAGRSLVGFGKNGIVYMISGDKASGFVLEKTRLPGRTASADEVTKARTTPDSAVLRELVDNVRRLSSMMDSSRRRGAKPPQ